MQPEKHEMKRRKKQNKSITHIYKVFARFQTVTQFRAWIIRKAKLRISERRREAGKKIHDEKNWGNFKVATKWVRTHSKWNQVKKSRKKNECRPFFGVHGKLQDNDNSNKLNGVFFLSIVRFISMAFERAVDLLNVSDHWIKLIQTHFRQKPNYTIACRQCLVN